MRDVWFGMFLLSAWFVSVLLFFVLEKFLERVAKITSGFSAGRIKSSINEGNDRGPPP